MLEPLGVPVHTAVSGEEALRMLLQGDSRSSCWTCGCLAWMDCQTAGLIKARDRTHDIPIIFLTAAHDEVGDILRGVRSWRG